MWSKKLLSILLWGAFFRSLSFASTPRKIYNHFIQFEKIKSGFSLLHVEENSTHENWAKDAKCKKLQNIDFFLLLCFSRFVLHSMMMFLQDLFYLNMSLDDMHKSILNIYQSPTLTSRLDFSSFPAILWHLVSLHESEKRRKQFTQPLNPFLHPAACLEVSFYALLCKFFQHESRKVFLILKSCRRKKRNAIWTKEWRRKDNDFAWQIAELSAS